MRVEKTVFLIPNTVKAQVKSTGGDARLLNKRTPKR